MEDTRFNILSSIFEVENIYEKILSNKLCDYNLLLNTLSKVSYTLVDDLNISAYKLRNITKTLWPDKPSTNTKICTYLFLKYGMKYCPNCNLVKEICDFSANASKNSKYNTHCKECYKNTTRDYQREYQKTRKALKLSRVPSWANLEKIKDIYYNCPIGFHVDHIVPLQGDFVSGLHVENNLQYLTAKDNLTKHNRHIII